METKSVKIGHVIIGGGFPIAVQTMWKKPLTKNTDEVLAEIKNLKDTGCDIVRFSVPDSTSAEYLGKLVPYSVLPLVADIHFDYRLALECIGFGIDKVRINPGNIGALWKVEEIVRAASDKNTPLRVGVNGGSLPRDLQHHENRAEAMVEAAERELNVLERLGFKDVVFSLKSSDIESTVTANILFSEKYNYPLHLGITEAGPLIPGIVKSTIALSKLLKKGIGDTIRVSLSDEPFREVIAGNEILKASGLKNDGVSIISCPKCGRASFDTHTFVKKLEPLLYSIKKNISIAIMGCIVNGPGEARDADLGITGSGDNVVIFRKGKIVHRIKASEAVKRFTEELEKIE